ncbi:MAG: S24 family peptidase [Candidatus Moranbacteria bacterium]|nr:S24 family peptidase [Candidatus Moranbacteria bacterium]
MDSIILYQKIQAFYEDNKRMPSVREIRDRIIRTKSMRKTKELVDALVDEGVLRRDKKGKLTPTNLFTSVKKLGFVEAGFPSPAEEELLDTMTLDEWLIQRREATYMLEVKGQSMINAGIRPGDTALVERGKQPKHGDIVIACVDGKWTMKYYHILPGKKIVLVPANPKFPTIYPKEELRIEAIVTAIIRKY